MVRKWSYLENSSTINSPLTLTKITKLYNFKVFRKTTRFKKYNKGITRMVRKNYARRKHRTNWINLFYITKNWVLNYMSMRQFERFYSSAGRFNFTTSSVDPSVFFLKLPNVLNKNGLNIFSCSRSVLNKHLQKTQTSLFLVNYAKNSRSSSIQTNDVSSILMSNEIYPSIINFDSNYYSPDDLVSILEKNSDYFVVQNLANSLLKHPMSITTTIYQILVLLTLFNSQR